MLVIEELDDGHPGITVVDIVAKAGGINNGQTDCNNIILLDSNRNGE